ncbi:hypothetical protein MRB53_015674 [Persea americana]|uniref:Uncharacterized protein n=1 Tax=Persea americana TaxID=3435 RepID=A0ACC2M005_PERAE|nr:hypothetical protein MRB53_015674 [Persea americana]
MAAEAVLSAVLKELLSKLSSLVQNETGLLWGLEKDKQKLESNLSVIRAVLYDAEKQQEEAVESRPPISRTRETDSYVIKSEVRGRKNEAEKLIHSLINSENEEVLSVIPIVGMGGMGKTTLAQLVFNDERVGTHFDLKMWVYVSKDFDVGRLLKEILQSAIKGKADELSLDLLHAHL